MMRATICNCVASGLALSKAVANAGRPASAPVSWALASSARRTTALCSFSSVRLPPVRIRLLRALAQACDPYSEVAPRSAVGPLAPT